MFHIHGIQGRVLQGRPEQLREQQLVTRVARSNLLRARTNDPTLDLWA